MDPSNECTIGMNAFSMCTPVHLLFSSLNEIAPVKTVLVGYRDDYEPIQLPMSNDTVS